MRAVAGVAEAGAAKAGAAEAGAARSWGGRKLGSPKLGRPSAGVLRTTGNTGAERSVEGGEEASGFGVERCECVPERGERMAPCPNAKEGGYLVWQFLTLSTPR